MYIVTKSKHKCGLFIFNAKQRWLILNVYNKKQEKLKEFKINMNWIWKGRKREQNWKSRYKDKKQNKKESRQCKKNTPQHKVAFIQNISGNDIDTSKRIK